MSQVVAVLDGFKYLFKKKPMLGAYAYMETLAQAFLRYGRAGAYQCYFSSSELSVLSREEMGRLARIDSRVRICPLDLAWPKKPPRCDVLYMETIQPERELVFRRWLERDYPVPVTRNTYTIATRGHLRELLDVCLLNLGGRPFDALVVLSHPTKAAVEALMADVADLSGGALTWRGRVEVIPPGLEIEAFKPIDRLEARRALKLPSDTVIILSIARLSSSSKMTYSRMLDALARIQSRTSQRVLLVLAGAGSDQEVIALEAAIAARGLVGLAICRPNFADGEKVALLSAADIFLSLSDNLQESFGIALVEAMAVGLPIVCTDWDGYRDIVRPAMNGFLVPTTWEVQDDLIGEMDVFRHPYSHETIQATAQAIFLDEAFLDEHLLLLVERPELRSSYAERNRTEARERFNIRRTVESYERLWQELAAIATRDSSQYRNLAPALTYDYPRHFRSYPTRTTTSSDPGERLP
jgi:glycosyltransferase involved in cell wall biosynthesis